MSIRSKFTPFRSLVLDFAHTNHRPMPWRETRDPYAIMVSEVMLQQTQVDRVMPKYENFMKSFPTVHALATAPFKDVLAHWSGLGYNRRALWLHEAAKTLVEKYEGQVPADPIVLAQLKGIGPNTAAAICVYAFNQPLIFIETNIRTVFIHHFFADRESIHDNDIIPLVKESLDEQDPRTWYWALMDYGSHLKKLHKNPSRKSAHHSTQSTFEGSRRQVRGKILKYLLERGPTTPRKLALHISSDTFSINDVIASLLQEGIIKKAGGKLSV